jgi:hypothetical protein
MEPEAAELPLPGGQDVPPAWRAGVAMQLAALLEQARLVEEFPLPDEPEPAAAFVP